MNDARRNWRWSSVVFALTTLVVVLGQVPNSRGGELFSEEARPTCQACDNSLFEPCPHCLNSDGVDCEPAADDGFAAASPLASEPALAFSEQSAAFAGPTFAAMPSVGGYIDDAVIRSRVRLRYDNAKNANFPDRAEYIYPIGSQFGGRGPASFGGGDIGSVNLQEIRTYFEWAWSPAFSAFGVFPVRFVNADSGSGGVFFDPISQAQSDNIAGAGDISAGLRCALIADPNEYLTAQFRAFAPTGDPTSGLGTGHTSLEVGILYQRRYANRWTVFGELTDWVAINASRFSANGGALDPDSPLIGRLAAGNVLRYGLGLGYDIWSDSNACRENRLTGVFEVVGWTVLDGFKTDGDTQVIDADGDTIINGKYGFRYNFGSNTVYAGYGTRWTEQRWYTDLLRIEIGHYF